MSWAELRLDEGWELVGPDGRAVPAAVPGQVAGALGAVPDGLDLDEHAWTYRCRFAAPQGGWVVLHLDGLATHASVVLDGEVVLESRSMWQAHAVDLNDRLRPEGNALELRFAPLGPEVRRPRKPRARWRTKLVANGLRWERTMLLGRAPGIAPGPPVVGPWRPVWLEVRDGPGVAALAVRPGLDGDDGVLRLEAEVVGAVGVEAVLTGPSGEHRAPLDADGRGELRVPGVARWWPHTHGAPVLHDLRLEAGGDVLARRRVGFRTLAAGAGAGHDVERDGLDLHVNGVRVHARGAVWTPLELRGTTPSEAELRATLTALRDGGMNLVRVVGTGAYQAPAFHDLCDELGLLVWQDAMLANLDVPLEDPEFRATVVAELAALTEALAGRPSTAVLCGGSEVGQQVAMLGLPLELARAGVGYELLPAAVAAAGCDAVVVPDAPSGGARPFRADVGVANYFGVGGYRRGLDDVRRAGVRFASECLALANVPDAAGLEGAGPDGGVPRDAGSDWDFADVRDHYLQLLHDVDPAALRASDPERYLAISRAVSGEVMGEVLGEWRRAGSPCGGGLVLWLRDLLPGSGWGLLDHRGTPKAAWHHLRRALAPLAVWTTDEGVNGIAVHAANDGPEPWAGELTVTVLARGEHVVETSTAPFTLPAHGAATVDAEEHLGRWLDLTHAYRFGPLAHDAVVVQLRRDGAVAAEAVRRIGPRDTTPRTAADLGLRATLLPGPALELETRVLLHEVRVDVPGWRAADDAFPLPPGTRRLPLTPLAADPPPLRATLTALNLDGMLPSNDRT